MHPERRSLLTVDLEEYFQVEAFSGVVPRHTWASYPSRLVEATHRLLDLFDRYDARATFFILGWNAKRHPRLVREIVERGHEPACHSYWHRPVYELTRREFLEETRQAKNAIEEAAGTAVAGYRAPSFSITHESL
jgi:polysaccharide deacetylase family protein (PEP-CTERM system associated)